MPSTPAAVAAHAAGVVESHCADAAAKRATASADAMATVTQTLAEVSRSHDLTSSLFLLYWRARLYDCLSYDERADADYGAFADAGTGQTGLRALVRDARRRAARLGLGKGGKPAPGAVVVGAALVGVGGACLGLAGWQASEMAATQQEYKAGLRPWAETEALGVQGVSQARAGEALAVVGALTGTAGVVTWIVAGVTGGAPLKVALGWGPTRGGAAFALAGRW